ncbi:unnamed protein product, partial [Brassica rapa subsp. trilocularis]
SLLPTGVHLFPFFRSCSIFSNHLRILLPLQAPLAYFGGYFDENWKSMASPITIICFDYGGSYIKDGGERRWISGEDEISHSSDEDSCGRDYVF